MNNTYEAAEVVEIGQAHDLILGIKELVSEDNPSGTPDWLFPEAFARFDE